MDPDESTTHSCTPAFGRRCSQGCERIREELRSAFPIETFQRFRTDQGGAKAIFMKKPRTVAIIQARMGSSRLPGKVIMKIGGRPLLVYLFERISRARTLDAIVVATTTNQHDNIIIEECERRGIPNFRGSELDVLGRYVSAARACDAEIIVRVTADNPLTDPDSIDRVVDALAASDAEYAIETGLPVGTCGEAMTWDGLSFINSVANTPRWREHV